MYNKVTVIGLGTLGGFLCKHISELDFVKELVIVDYDIVESKNVFKSIYKYIHVGELKVNALAELINDDVTVTKIYQEYAEGKTVLPKSDLVIDCRDIVCDRYNEIDVRFYISEKILIIDCRKSARSKHSYNGSYSIQLPKSEINKAAYFAAQIISSRQIDNMISNNLIQRVNLNLLTTIMNKSIKQTLENRMDMIYELSDNAQRLQCIEEHVKPLLHLNNKHDVEVFVGERTKNLEAEIIQFPDVAKTRHAVIPKNKLTNSLDVIQSLANIVSLQPGVSNFIVTIRKKGGQEYVELLEETGAA